MNPTQETWKPVVGSAGRYDVSDLGRVRANRWTTRTANGQTRTYRPHIMSTYVEARTGYLALRLTIDGKTVLRRVHTLVAEAFIGPRPDGAVVCHNDSDPSNNSLSNLRYDTHLGNSGDMVAAGNSTFGERQVRAVLTEAMVRYARQRYVPRSRTDGLPAIARDLGVNAGTLKAAVTGRTWKYLDN